MKDSELSKYFSEIGRRGGKRRLKTMTKEERRRIASLGGSASKGKPKKAAFEQPTAKAKKARHGS